MIAVTMDHRLHVSLPPGLVGESERGHEGNLSVGKSRVGARYCANPKPGDDIELLPDERFEVGPLSRHFCGDFDGWIQMANALLRLFPHPRAVIAHVLRKAGGTRPSALRID